MVDQISSAAERARTVLAAATSLSVTAGRRRVHLSGRHATDPAGRTLLDLPPDSGLGAAVAGGREPSPVEVTDVAPVAMRRREFPRLDRDVRLPFGTPLAAAADAPGRLLDLLAGAHRCPRRAR
ncbi:MAG TPA: hypothetical protein VES42_26920 [Pilimelia sp.]|nr:hypothetical protein [Pilimelia sp.]